MTSRNFLPARWIFPAAPEGKTDEAKKEYQQAIALEPNLRAAADALARMH